MNKFSIYILLSLSLCLSASANIVFPPVVVTMIEDSGSFSGVDTNGGYGSFSVATTNVTFEQGDTVEVTIAAAPGNQFQLEAGTTGVGLSVTYGSAFINNDVPTSVSVAFNGLSGGAAPVFNPGGQSGTALFGGPSGLFAGTQAAPWSVADTVTFDSITFMLTTSTVSPITVSSDPVTFVFYAGTGQLSLVPVPEPRSLALVVGFFTLACVTAGRRRV